MAERRDHQLLWGDDLGEERREEGERFCTGS